MRNNHCENEIKDIYYKGDFRNILNQDLKSFNINDFKDLFFARINKIDKSNPYLTRECKKSLNAIINEKEVTTDIVKIQKVLTITQNYIPTN